MDDDEFMEYFATGEDDSDTVEENCPHDSTQTINNSIICLECGAELDQIIIEEDRGIEGMTNKFYKKKTQNIEGSVSQECRSRGFEEEVSDIAERKYQLMMQKASAKGIPETHRGRPRKALICNCLFFAIMSKGESSITLSEIGEKFKISSQPRLNLGKEVYLKFFPEDSKIRQKPIDLIPNVMIRAGIDLNYIPKIEGILHALENRSSVITSSKSMSIAATMTYIFLCLNEDYKKSLGYDSIKAFSDAIKMSNITISKKSEEGLRILHEMQRIKEMKYSN